MKVTIPGKTPLDRLTELTRRIVAVPKTEIAEPEKKQPANEKHKRRRKK